MSLIDRTGIQLRGNPHRVMCRLFIPGEEELIRGTSRARELVDRCLMLTEEQVQASVEETLQEFGSRHRDLASHLNTHFAAVSSLIPDDFHLTKERRELIGAYLTQEYAFESTAYFNPSMVEHPRQDGAADGELRFIMSVRAVGEGHLSSLIFRTGTLTSAGGITIDEPSPYATTRASRFTALRSRMVRQAAVDAGVEMPELDFVLSMLPDTFTPEDLVSRLATLPPHFDTPENHARLTSVLTDISGSAYEVDFDPQTDLSERVMWPTSRDERRGIEDARFTRCAEAGGGCLYRATYTGFDGMQVVSRVLETADFCCFTSMPLTGKAVRNKGVAFFPRQIDGRHVALSRWDRQANSVAISDDGYHWNESVTIHVATEPWELVHVGNCGSPIETPDGWLVLTHGAGPMRKYVIGALLLDLRDPTQVIATFPGPLLEATEEERNGYVPNVVYSCGSLIYGETLFLPYGFSDWGTSVVRIQVSELMDRMKDASRRRVLV